MPLGNSTLIVFHSEDVDSIRVIELPIYQHWAIVLQETTATVSMTATMEYKDHPTHTWQTLQALTKDVAYYSKDFEETYDSTEGTIVPVFALRVDVSAYTSGTADLYLYGWA